MISLGIEQLLLSPPKWISQYRLGLLCNQASTDSRFSHSRDLLNQHFPNQLTCLFTPQHGFFSEKQDNMIESNHGYDPVSGLPVYSLYSRERRPSKEMFDLFDVLIIDLFDVGTRVYTFLYTMAYCLEAAAQYGKRVLVLDRPNPVGGLYMEGNIIQEDCFSFVGLYPIPMRHGLTFGELALLLTKGVPLDKACDVISQVQAPPGRMQRVAMDGPAVYVDYAHSPAALESVLNALRAHCTGRLWCVFGCGGERDRGKRPEMGRVAGELADFAIATAGA